MAAERPARAQGFDWEQIKARLPLALQHEETPEQLQRLFRQRADVLAQVQAQHAHNTGALHLELGAGDVRLGVEMTAVRTIVDVRRATRIPCAPEAIAHVLHVEGRIATLADLGVIFGQQPLSKLDGGTFAVLLDVPGTPLALWVDRVHGLRPIDPSRTVRSARSGPGSDVLSGISADMTLVLSVELLVTSLRVLAQ
jgi:chemotaxis signal transduction protein